MPNAVTRANAPALPTRRAALATLAGAGTALALPKGAKAADLTTSSDAALIAQVAKVEALAKRERLAIDRRCALEGVAEGLHPKRPVKRSVVDGPDIRVEKTLDGGTIIYAPPPSTYSDANVAAAEHATAVKAHEAECEAIDQRCGLHAANRLYDRIERRLSEAGATLAAMTPTTREGVAAKARGCLAALVAYEDAWWPEWMDDLMRSTLRDVVAIGGVA